MSRSPLLVSATACSSAPRLDIDEVGTVLLKTDGDKEGRGEKQCNLLQRSLNSLSLHIYTLYSRSADSVCIDVVALFAFLMLSL